MKALVFALASLGVAAPAVAAEKQAPPAPAVEPDWTLVRKQAEARLKQQLFDPGSAQVTWTEGFRWGYVKPLLGKRTYQWVACGTLNAKNRMGGYVGTMPFHVGLQPDQRMLVEVENGDTITQIASCDAPDVHVEPQPALLDAHPSSSESFSVADELAKLVELRDRGVLSPAEFDQQKAKLLAR